MKYKIIFSGLFLLLTSSIYSETAHFLLKEVQGKYQKSADFSADFKQVITYNNLKRVGISSGFVRYKKKNMVKWVQKKPDESHYISSGSKMWLYLPEDEQVFINKDMKNTLDRVGLLFLSAPGDILKTFDVHVLIKKKDKKKVEEVSRTLQTEVNTPFVLYDFVPQKPDSIKIALVRINRKKQLITTVTIIDLALNKTVINLRNIKLNSGISDRYFHFVPPKNAEVFSQ